MISQALQIPADTQNRTSRQTADRSDRLYACINDTSWQPQREIWSCARPAATSSFQEHGSCASREASIFGRCAIRSTPQGMFWLQVLGAVVQQERSLICERTKAEIRAAKTKKRLPSIPGIGERRPATLAKMKPLASNREATAPSRYLGRYSCSRVVSMEHRNAFVARSNGWLSRVWPMQPCSVVTASPAERSPDDVGCRHSFIQSCTVSC